MPEKKRLKVILHEKPGEVERRSPVPMELPLGSGSEGRIHSDGGIDHGMAFLLLFASRA